MAYLGVLAAGALNCFLAYYISFVTLTGGETFFERVRLYAFSWIAATTLVALILCAFRWRLTALWIAVSAIPTGLLTFGAVLEARKFLGAGN